MAIMIAPDAFKGTFRASEVAAALGRGVERAGLEPPDLCPIADGGEGTAEALLLALGGETRGAGATDPLGRAIHAPFALIEEGGTAIVEVASASGLALVADHERDAVRASSRGTGALVAAAVQTGAAVVLVAAGGSATTDGGAGAITEITERGGLRGTRLVVLCDVRTPFEDAAHLFAPQKGASADEVQELSRRLDALASGWERDPRGRPMTGAAGGLAGGLWAALGAVLLPGAAFVLETVGFDERLDRADAVITGEGRLDGTTLAGKAVSEVAGRARTAGVPCWALCGEDALGTGERDALGLAGVLEASTLAALTEAGAQVAANL